MILRWSSVIAAAALFLISALPAGASFQEGGGKFAAYNIASTILPNVFPTYPLKKGQLTVTLVPAYATFKETGSDQNSGLPNGQDLSGWGGGAALTYAFTNHLGLAVMGTTFKATGTSSLVNENNSARNGDETAKGTAGSVNFIFDRWGDPDGFHWPNFIGLSYSSLDQTTEISGATSPGSVPSSLTDQRKTDALGVSAGTSIQFNTGELLRWAPFAMVNVPLKDPVETCSGTGNFSCGSIQQAKGKNVFATGLAVTLRPWNLSFLYAAPVDATAVYTVKWQHAFGGN